MINVKRVNAEIQDFLTNFGDMPIDQYGLLTYTRMAKKFQKPCKKVQASLKAKAWSDWISFDDSLHVRKNEGRFPAFLYKVRELIHHWIRDFRVSEEVSFTPGEHSIPSRGAVSVEAKLSRPWACTHENVERFANIVMSHKALKRALKRKSGVLANQPKYQRMALAGCERAEIFEEMVRDGCELVHGSRFSSVPKTNAKRRPINIEPLANIITQRQIGLGLCRVLSKLGNDIDKGQELHRKRIASQVATIDLSNASDSVSIELVDFLFPTWFCGLLHETRSPMVFHDGCYYVTKKISAMGNGYTFELMTLILLAVCRILDSEATVYGDDIIISNDAAPLLLDQLSQIGFSPNEDKSFVNSPFRESCGAYFLDGTGYLETYDFEWAESELDAVTLVNKVYRMTVSQQENPLVIDLRNLHDRLMRSVDRRLRGPDDGGLPPYVVDPNFEWHANNYKPSRKERLLSERLQTRCRKVAYYRVVSDLRTKTRDHLSSRHWAKYEMYLHSGRRAMDHLSSARCRLYTGLALESGAYIRFG